MGKPATVHAVAPVTEYIGNRSETRRSETSQYPQVKEINRDCPSSGERTGKSLNLSSVKSMRVAVRVLWGLL